MTACNCTGHCKIYGYCGTSQLTQPHHLDSSITELTFVSKTNNSNLIELRKDVDRISDSIALILQMLSKIYPEE